VVGSAVGKFVVVISLVDSDVLLFSEPREVNIVFVRKDEPVYDGRNAVGKGEPVYDGRNVAGKFVVAISLLDSNVLLFSEPREGNVVFGRKDEPVYDGRNVVKGMRTLAVDNM
jgi:ribosomal protein L14E/L6E/L27E